MVSLNHAVEVHEILSRHHKEGCSAVYKREVCRSFNRLIINGETAEMDRPVSFVLQVVPVKIRPGKRVEIISTDCEIVFFHAIADDEREYLLIYDPLFECLLDEKFCIRLVPSCLGSKPDDTISFQCFESLLMVD